MLESDKTKENIEVLFERLENFMKSKTVVGETIVVGDTTLVPFLSVSFGLGSGGGDGGDDKGNKGVGGGAGIGAKALPVAVLVIKGDKVDLLPITKQANLGKLLEMVPGLIAKIKPATDDCCDEGAPE
ncbi:MAG TPA: spore germination protein GerW family protein [Bacillota bacterium]|nr:spore germination protein GerW family protein [Bacillota bacterium]